MLVLENIERVPAPTRAEFEQRWVKEHVPVIFTGLFAGQPIDAMRTEAAFRERFESLRVGLTTEYFSQFLATGMMKPPVEQRAYEWSTAGAYLDEIARDPTTRRMCTEQELPPAFDDVFDVPELAALGYDESEGMASFLFLGNESNVAHLHFDGDQRHVLLHQVFGRKRVTLMEPRVSKRLQPMLHWSLVCLETMSDAERLQFMRFAEARDAILHPGETIYIPPLYWHHLDYLDTAASFNLRFGRDPELAFARQIVPDMFLQNVMSTVMRWGSTDPRRATVVGRLKAALAEETPARREKYQRVRAELEALYAELCEDSIAGLYAVGADDLVHRNLDQIFGEGAYY